MCHCNVDFVGSCTVHACVQLVVALGKSTAQLHSIYKRIKVPVWSHYELLSVVNQVSIQPLNTIQQFDPIAWLNTSTSGTSSIPYKTNDLYFIMRGTIDI